MQEQLQEQEVAQLKGQAHPVVDYAKQEQERSVACIVGPSTIHPEGCEAV